MTGIQTANFSAREKSANEHLKSKYDSVLIQQFLLFFGTGIPNSNHYFCACLHEQDLTQSTNSRKTKQNGREQNFHHDQT